MFYKVFHCLSIRLICLYKLFTVLLSQLLSFIFGRRLFAPKCLNMSLIRELKQVLAKKIILWPKTFLVNGNKCGMWELLKNKTTKRASVLILIGYDLRVQSSILNDGTVARGSTVNTWVIWFETRGSAVSRSPIWYKTRGSTVQIRPLCAFSKVRLLLVFLKMGHTRPLFLYFRLFNLQLTVNKCSI